jgi:hypothetical protein
MSKRQKNPPAAAQETLAQTLNRVTKESGQPNPHRVRYEEPTAEDLANIERVSGPSRKAGDTIPLNELNEMRGSAGLPPLSKEQVRENQQRGSNFATEGARTPVPSEPPTKEPQARSSVLSETRSEEHDRIGGNETEPPPRRLDSQENFDKQARRGIDRELDELSPNLSRGPGDTGAKRTATISYDDSLPGRDKGQDVILVPEVDPTKAAEWDRLQKADPLQYTATGRKKSREAVARQDPENWNENGQLLDINGKPRDPNAEYTASGRKKTPRTKPKEGSGTLTEKGKERAERIKSKKERKGELTDAGRARQARIKKRREEKAAGLHPDTPEQKARTEAALLQQKHEQEHGKGIFSTDDFKARVKGGFAQPSLWAITIPTLHVPKPERFAELQRGMAFMCNQAVVPGRHFATQEINHFGPIRKMPYQSIYDDLQVSIFCRADMKERKFFEAWQDKIHNNKHHQWSYFNSYVQDLELVCYTPIWQAQNYNDEYNSKYGAYFGSGQNNESTKALAEAVSGGPRSKAGGTTGMHVDAMRKRMIVHKIKFVDAYPLNVQPIGLDWGARDQIMNMNVTFAYRKWHEMDVPGFKVQELANGGEVEPQGPGIKDMISWAADTIDTIDLFTGSIPSWMKTGTSVVKNLHGLEGTVSAVKNKARGIFAGLL